MSLGVLRQSSLCVSDVYADKSMSTVGTLDVVHQSTSV